MSYLSKYTGKQIDRAIEAVSVLMEQSPTIKEFQSLQDALNNRPWEVMPGLPIYMDQFFRCFTPDWMEDGWRNILDSNCGSLTIDPEGIKVDRLFVEALRMGPSVIVPSQFCDGNSQQRIVLSLGRAKSLDNHAGIVNYSFASPLYVEEYDGEEAFAIWTFQVDQNKLVLLSISYDYFIGEDAKYVHREFREWCDTADTVKPNFPRATQGYYQD